MFQTTNQIPISSQYFAPDFATSVESNSILHGLVLLGKSLENLHRKPICFFPY